MNQNTSRITRIILTSCNTEANSKYRTLVYKCIILCSDRTTKVDGIIFILVESVSLRSRDRLFVSWLVRVEAESSRRLGLSCEPAYTDEMM